MTKSARGSMEMDNYGLVARHSKSHGADSTRKFQAMEVHSFPSILPGTSRKEQEFIDHTLLAPTYIRDSNNFIMDLIENPVVFPKNDSHDSNVTTNSALSPDLNFQSSIFHFVNKESNLHGNDDILDSVAASATLVVPSQSMPMSTVVVEENNQNYNHKLSSGFISLNSDFLEPNSNKQYCSTVVQNHNTTKDVNEQFSRLPLLTNSNETLDESNVMSDNEMMFAKSNAPKILPHKKRISRKLKGTEHSAETNFADVNQKVTEQEPLAVTAMQFSCEICGNTTSSQLSFFTHLKQHYEPTTPDTIIAAMKTSMETFEPVKDCEHICSEITKEKSEGNVFHQLNFDDFNNVNSAEPIVLSQNQEMEMKIVNSTNIENVINFESPSNAVDANLKSSDEVEFSDTEDMLEGIRNVVDKVSIEDTCDDIEIMTENGIRAPWFTSDNFSNISFKSKSFADVNFSRAFAELPETDNISHESSQKKLLVPEENYSDYHGLLLQKDMPTLTKSEENCNHDEYKVKTIVDQNIHSDSFSKSLSLEDINSKDAKKITNPESSSDIEKTNIDNEFGADGSYSLETDIEEKDSEPKKFFCDLCNRFFNSSNALKYHRRTHSGIRPHQCDICGRSFFALGALKSHMRTHTGDKPFECSICKRKFRQWGDLKYHTISLHSDVKSYQCEFCGKAFSRKYSLDLHRRIHTSERDYICEFCDKRFRASTYLQNHRKIHTGEKPHECDKCSKRFRVPGDLRRHMRIHERLKTTTKKVSSSCVPKETSPVSNKTLD